MSLETVNDRYYLLGYNHRGREWYFPDTEDLIQKLLQFRLNGCSRQEIEYKVPPGNDDFY